MLDLNTSGKRGAQDERFLRTGATCCISVARVKNRLTRITSSSTTRASATRELRWIPIPLRLLEIAEQPQPA
jgi:hypothetical protein